MLSFLNISADRKTQIRMKRADAPDRMSSSPKREPLPTSANTAPCSFPVCRFDQCRGRLLPFASWLFLVIPTDPTFMSD